MYKYISLVAMLSFMSITNVQSANCPGLIPIIPQTSGTAHVTIIGAIKSSKLLHRQPIDFPDPAALENLILAAKQTDTQQVNWKTISEGEFCGIEFSFIGKDGKKLSAKIIKK